MSDEHPPELIVKIKGENMGRIYEYVIHSRSKPGSAWFEHRSPLEEKCLNIDELKSGEGDYKVYEPKIGDNISPFNTKSLIKLYGNENVDGFVINSIDNTTLDDGRKVVSFILRDKITGNLIERRIGRLAKKNAEIRLALAKCMDSELLKELPIDLIKEIAKNILPEDFSPGDLTIKMDLDGGGDKRNYNKINTKKKSKKKSKKRKKSKKSKKRSKRR